MSRSVKKGPYVEPKLLKRVEELNEKNEKKRGKKNGKEKRYKTRFTGSD